MDNSILYVIMISMGMLMAALPFAVFMGLGTMLELAPTDSSLLVTYMLLAGVVIFLGCLGSFTLLQRQNCKKPANMSQISSNAGLAFGIQAVTLLLVHFLPFLRNLVTNLLPPEEQESPVGMAVGFSYFSFWATLFGVALGGGLSGVCT